MNNFLRAQFSHFSVNSIIRTKRAGMGILCGLVAIVALMSPLSSFADGFAGATISPTVSSPQLVCSGSSAVITLTTSGCLGTPDWTGNYVVDSSHDGGTTWFTPSGVASGTASFSAPIITYTSPPLINTSAICSTLVYRIRITGIVNHCFTGTTTYTSPLAGVQVCRTPAPVTGPDVVCVGRSITLATTSTGGTWSSGNISRATVTTAGVVSGISAGTVTISYSFASGCSATKVVTVIAAPAPITGPTSVCAGTINTYSLTAGPFTGTWSSSNTTVGTIGSTTGTFTALSAGTTVITDTNIAGCYSTLTVTVNALPTVYAITGGGSYCAGNTGVTVGMANSQSGVNYQLYNGASATGAVVAGTGTAFSFGTFTAAGTYTVLATTTAGCSSAMSSTAVIVINPLPAAIAGPSSICLGTTGAFSDPTAGGTWSSSPTGPGSIDPSSGIFNSASPATAGIATITYALSTGCYVTKSLTVNPAAGPISGPTGYCVGGTGTLTSSPAGGNWISSNMAVATVGLSTGVVNAVGSGTANITYTVTGGCRSIITVSVNLSPSPITGVRTVCGDGDTTQLTSTPGGGTWSTINPAIATVGPLGIVVGHAGGDTTTVIYSLSASCYVTAVVTVNLAPTPISGPSVVCQGQTITLTNGSAGGIWSSNPAGVAPINPSGVVTGGTLGTAIITYSLPGGCDAYKTVSVEPVPGPITGTLAICVGNTSLLSSTTSGGTWSWTNSAIDTVDPTGVLYGAGPGTDIVAYTLSTGCRATAVVTVSPLPSVITGPTQACMGSNITLVSGPSGGTWSSSIPPIGSIDPTTGVFTGLLPGTTDVTYILPTGCYRSITVTVQPLPLPNDGTHIVCVGSITNLNNPSPGGPGTWASSNPPVAAINSVTGVVTGMSLGTATITFTLPTGCRTTSVVTVNPLPAPITGYARTCIGFCTPLGSTTSGGTWSSLDVSVATVGTGGSLCGVSPGTAIISYTLPTGCATVIIATVDAIPAPPTGTLSICLGGTTTLSHTIPGGTWSSSDTVVAKVFLGTGTVTGFTAGTANITYTLASGCTAFATVTVNPVPPASTGTLYMCVGNTTTLSNLYPGGTWVSGHPTVATVVSTTGVVTGINAGIAVISYVLPAGCAATVNVTVYPLPVITGSVLVCPGIASTLTGSPAGGLWASSTPIIATIGSLSGVVTGINTGTSTITYTLASTCRSTTIVTVQPLPAPITGPSQVCVGSTITLTNLTTGGGTWSSSNPTIGSIDAGGVVTGISAGVINITFTATTTGCIITKSVTVNPLPAAITGTTEVCVGSTITLSSATGGGSWSSSGVFATVGAATGIVTGVSDGVEEITYTLPTGCLTTFLVTVNPLPSPITGALVLCFSYTTLLSSATPGGIWSINPTSVATIDASGLVTAVGTGTATVTYTLPTTGCAVTAIVTVNPLPGPITGILNICLNDTTTLHDTTLGGSWTSDNIFIAVINPSSGLLASVSEGTVHITYTLPTGCYTTAIMTINPIPPPITGVFSVCVGLTTTLSDTLFGGSWSSSNAAIASVGSSTGVVTGHVPGTAVISYTLPSSCSRTVVVTVNPNPLPITGITSICQGDTTILSSPTPGGTWSSSMPGIAFIFMPTGQMIGLTTGTSIITYKLPTGCLTATTVIVNPVPTASTITGSRSICVNSFSILANPAFPGGTWTSGNVGVATIGTFSGLLYGVSAGTANITYTLPTGCDTFITVTVNPLPSPITGTLAVCNGDNSLLSSTPGGGTWSSSNLTVGTINSTSGMFRALSPGLTVITYKLSTTGCEITAIVTVNPLPNPIVGPTDVCLGSTITLSSGPTGGGWSSSNPFVATIATFSAGFDSATVTGIAVGTAYMTYTLPTGCFITSFVEVHPLPNPITGPDTVCVGSTITLTSAPLSPPPGGTWTSGNVAVATIDATTGVLTGVSSGVVLITYTISPSPADCYATFTVTVHPVPTNIYGPDTVCVGFTITAIDTTAGGVWSISNASIASIDSVTGLITGITDGVTTISYTLTTGCYATRQVTVHPLPIITVNQPTVICKYASTVLTASGAGPGGKYTWSPGLGLSSTTGAVVTANPTVTTTYTVTGTSYSGCPNTAVVTVWVDSMLNDISVTGIDSICKGDCTVLMAHGREGTYFNWKPATALSCTICDTTTACPVVTTTYIMVAIDSLGCRDSLFYTVTVMNLPVLKVLPNPAIVCNGSTTQLHVKDSLATPGYVTRFAWFPNAFISCDTCADPIVSNTFNLIYRVIGITPFGCFDSLKVPVTVLDSAFNSINKDTVICIGGSAQLNAISFNPDGARSDFLWTNPVNMNNPYIHNPIVSPSSTTTYQVIITPNVCWPDTLYTTVVVVPYPDITITPPSATVSAGTTVPLTATINNEMIITNYAWSPPGSLSCIECYHTIATPSVTTTYTFTATSIYGCTSTRDVTITLGCDDAQVFIPNTFTPNGDGMNDRFYVSAKGVSTISKFLIYNRWGELVYERYNIQANDAAAGWDGQYKGIVLPPDVFVYIVEAKCNLGAEFRYKGDISIVR